VEQVFERLNLFAEREADFGNCDPPKQKLGEWVGHRVRMVQWRLLKGTRGRYMN